jgi:hypothetical protein
LPISLSSISSFPSVSLTFLHLGILSPMYPLYLVACRLISKLQRNYHAGD